MTLRNLFLSTSLMAVSTVNATAWVGLKVGELGPERSTEAREMFAGKLATDRKTIEDAVTKFYSKEINKRLGVENFRLQVGEGEMQTKTPADVVAQLTPLIKREAASSFKGYEAPSVAAIEKKLEGESYLNSFIHGVASTQANAMDYFEKGSSREDVLSHHVNISGVDNNVASMLIRYAFNLTQEGIQKLLKSTAPKADELAGGSNALSGDSETRGGPIPQNNAENPHTDTSSELTEEQKVQLQREEETIEKELAKCNKDEDGNPKKVTFKSPFVNPSAQSDESLSPTDYYIRLAKYYLGGAEEDSFVSRIKPLQTFLKKQEELFEKNLEIITEFESLFAELNDKVHQTHDDVGLEQIKRPKLKNYSKDSAHKDVITQKLDALENIKRVQEKYMKLQEDFAKSLDEAGIPDYFPRNLSHELFKEGTFSSFFSGKSRDDLSTTEDEQFFDYVINLFPIGVNESVLDTFEFISSRIRDVIKDDKVQQELKKKYSNIIDVIEKYNELSEDNKRYFKLLTKREKDNFITDEFVYIKDIREDVTALTVPEQFWQFLSLKDLSYWGPILESSSIDLSLEVAKGVQADLEKVDDNVTIIPDGFLSHVVTFKTGSSINGGAQSFNVDFTHWKDEDVIFDPVKTLIWFGFFFYRKDNSEKLEHGLYEQHIPKYQHGWDLHLDKEKRKTLLKSLAQYIHDNILVTSPILELKDNAKDDQKGFVVKNNSPNSPLYNEALVFGYMYNVIMQKANLKGEQFNGQDLPFFYPESKDKVQKAFAFYYREEGGKHYKMRYEFLNGKKGLMQNWVGPFLSA